MVKVMVCLVRLLGVCIVASGCSLASHGKTENKACESIAFEKYGGENIYPVSALEAGHFFFENGVAVSRVCARQRICEVNSFVMAEYSQSYYISLKTKGGAEMSRQFPETIKAIGVGRGDEKYIYLINFCRYTDG